MESSTIFDDVFRTMLEKMPQLAIPLINEVFHTSYSEEEPFEQLRNEHYEKFGTVVTDSIIRIGNHIYHLECQSTKDETMVIRMFEYDISIALEHASFAEHAVWEIEFPQSCVLYIRNHRSLPDYHEAIVTFADGQKVRYRGGPRTMAGPLQWGGAIPRLRPPRKERDTMKKQHTQKMTVRVTAQTAYNLERLMLMSGQKTPGRVVDKLVREKMLALRGRNIETEETK